MTDTQLMVRWSYARVVTPDHFWHGHPLSIVGPADDATVTMSRAGRTLEHATVGEWVQGDYRIEGTNADGVVEIWNVRRLSCGCNRHDGPTPTQEIPT